MRTLSTGDTLDESDSSGMDNDVVVAMLDTHEVLKDILTVATAKMAKLRMAGRLLESAVTLRGTMMRRSRVSWWTTLGRVG